MIDFFIADKAADLIKNEKFPRFLYKKGVATEGTFSLYMNLSDYTDAKIFTDTENDIPVTVRFSKVFGENGESDTIRDVISMNVRFFSEEGCLDMISHNIDIPEKLKAPERLIEILKIMKHDRKGMTRNRRSLIENIVENGDLTPFLIDYYSDRTTVKSYAGIEGYVLNDYVFRNSDGVCRDVKLKWVPEEGVKSISRNEAEFLAGYEPEAAVIDLCEHLERKMYPKFSLEAEVDGEKFVCGHLSIRKMAKDVVNETIQFTPSNVVPGIELKAADFNLFTAFMFNESARLRGGFR